MGSTIRRISDGRHSESHAEQRLPVVLRQQASRRFIEVRMGINKAWNDRLTLKIYHVHVNRDSYTITGSDLLNASIHNHDCARLNRSEEHMSELQSLMRISYAVFSLKQHSKHYTPINTSHY